jgi:hypothetical protein
MLSERFNLQLDAFGYAGLAAIGLALADGSRACLRCRGTGQRTVGYGPQAGQLETCYVCQGRKFFPALDVDAIRAAIKGRKGLRSARPKWIGGRGIEAMHASRCYYVWRMARFHGGVDMRMPMMADLEVGGDPFQRELDALADAAAIQYFGSDLRAARRWAAAGLF